MITKNDETDSLIVVLRNIARLFWFKIVGAGVAAIATIAFALQLAGVMSAEVFEFIFGSVCFIGLVGVFVLRYVLDIQADKK